MPILDYIMPIALVSKDRWMRDAAQSFRRTYPTGAASAPAEWGEWGDKDGDGRVNAAEYSEMMSQIFDTFDQDQDGTLSKSEVGYQLAEVGRANVDLAIKQASKSCKLQNQASWWSKNWWVVVVVGVVLLLLGFLGLAFYWRRRRLNK